MNIPWFGLIAWKLGEEGVIGFLWNEFAIRVQSTIDETWFLFIQIQFIHHGNDALFCFQIPWCKITTCLLYIVNNMATYGPAMQGARASASIILI